MPDHSTLELREGDIDEFFAVPFSVYPPSSPYVSPDEIGSSPLPDVTRNPLFLGTDVEPSSRLGAMANRSVGSWPTCTTTRTRIHRSKAQLLRVFRLRRTTPEVARTLLGAAQRWGRERGLRGDRRQLQSDGDAADGCRHRRFRPRALHRHAIQPAHIPALLEENGYERFFPMSTFELDLRGFDPDVCLGPRDSEPSHRDDMRWSPFAGAPSARSLAMRCGSSTNGSPRIRCSSRLPDEEFMFQAQEMMWIVDDRIAMLAYQKAMNPRA